MASLREFQINNSVISALEIPSTSHKTQIGRAVDEENCGGRGSRFKVESTSQASKTFVAQGDASLF